MQPLEVFRGEGEGLDVIQPVVRYRQIIVSLSWPSWPGVALLIVLIYVSGRPTIFFVTSQSTGGSTVTSTVSFVKPKKAILSTPVQPGVEPSVLSGLYIKPMQQLFIRQQFEKCAWSNDV
jgi:hypothetical protein